MKKTTTSERLKSILSERNLRQVDILEKVKPYCEKYNEKINKSHLSQWISGINEPNQRKLTILGEALGVSEVWLMGYDVPMEKESNNAYDLGATMADIVTGSDEDMSEVMEYYSKISKLTKEQKECVYDFIDVLIAKNESAE